MSWLTRAFHYAVTKLSAIWRTVSPKIKADFEMFATQFGDVALAAIQRQAMLTITGQQKLSNAADEVIAESKAAGWQILNTAAVTLVQDVYTAWKAQSGPLVAPPGDTDAQVAIAARTVNPQPNT